MIKSTKELTDKEGAKTLAQGTGWSIKQTPQGLEVRKNWALAKDNPRDWNEFSKAFRKFVAKRLEAYPQEETPPLCLPRLFAGLFFNLPTFEAQGQFIGAVFEFYFTGKEPAHLPPQAQLYFETCRPYLEKTKTAKPQTL